MLKNEEKEKMEMECPYQEKGRVTVCGASITRLHTSMEDQEAFCGTEDHYRCPMLLAHVLRLGSERPKRVH